MPNQTVSPLKGDDSREERCKDVDVEPHVVDVESHVVDVESHVVDRELCVMNGNTHPFDLVAHVSQFLHVATVTEPCMADAHAQTTSSKWLKMVATTRVNTTANAKCQVSTCLAIVQASTRSGSMTSPRSVLSTWTLMTGEALFPGCACLAAEPASDPESKREAHRGLSPTSSSGSGNTLVRSEASISITPHSLSWQVFSENAHWDDGLIVLTPSLAKRGVLGDASV